MARAPEALPCPGCSTYGPAWRTAFVRNLKPSRAPGHPGPVRRAHTPGVLAGWPRHAKALADWALSRVVVREDVHGAYMPDGSPYTSRDPLTRDLLIRHFR